MRILTIGHSYVVAMNRRLAQEWALAGHHVTVAAPAFYHADLRPMECETGQDEAFDIVRIPARLTRHVHVFRYGHALRELLRAGRFDVVHAWEEPFVFSGYQISRWAPRSTCLVYSTFQNLPKRYPPPFSWMERHALNKASGWTAFGRTIAENLSKRDIYAARPWAEIPLGVDLNQFRPRPEIRSQVLQEIDWSAEGPPVIGFVGRFVPEKGIDLLTSVLDRTEGAGDRWRVLFVGGGPMEARLRQWCKQKGERAAKVLTGVSHDRVPNVLNGIDIGVVPSQSTPRWKEQLGRILIEFMASGVPVIASDSGEIPYVVGGSGLISPESDQNAWMNALTGLVDDAEARRKLAAAGLDHARAHYDWAKVAARFVRFFETVADRRRV
jgi:glycosyltransferase involved in cell wall biosynthesis